MNKTRENILGQLRKNQPRRHSSPEIYLPDHQWTREERIERLADKMTAVHTEVHRMPHGQWIDWLNSELPQRQLNNVLVGCTDAGEQFASQAPDPLQVSCYRQDIEDWKDSLFSNIDVGITETRGGIAESGSLILWPSEQEPRLMSLVPPVHVALLDADKIHETFAQAMHSQHWADAMPTNALLISGPSKTADIEQTLAYGIHGPKQLIVLVLE